jgi:2-amino-4-hydroxy-6-hydroxymethyldihydropteridine diphosphokinase
VSNGLAICFLDGKNYSIYHMEASGDPEDMKTHYESYVYDEFFTSVYIVGSKKTSQKLVSDIINWTKGKMRLTVKNTYLCIESDKKVDIGIDTHKDFFYREIEDLRLKKAYLLLGSNIDKEKNMPRAIALLKSITTVSALSTIIETAPIGTTHQANFYNCAVEIDTHLSLDTIKKNIIIPIETRLKRVRTEDENAARTIDIDVIIYDNVLIDPEINLYDHIRTPIQEIFIGPLPL